MDKAPPDTMCLHSISWPYWNNCDTASCWFAWAYSAGCNGFAICWCGTHRNDGKTGNWRYGQKHKVSFQGRKWTFVPYLWRHSGRYVLRYKWRKTGWAEHKKIAGGKQYSNKPVAIRTSCIKYAGRKRSCTTASFMQIAVIIYKTQIKKLTVNMTKWTVY